MDWLTNEIMFYGGIIIEGSSLAVAVIYLVVSHIRKIRIDMQLDEEYGKIEVPECGNK